VEAALAVSLDSSRKIIVISLACGQSRRIPRRRGLSLVAARKQPKGEVTMKDAADDSSVPYLLYVFLTSVALSLVGGVAAVFMF
jgi:hypothetical protein